MSGGNIPADANLTLGYRPGYITLTAKPEAELTAFQLEIVGETVGYEPPIRRQAIAPGMITAVMGTDQKPFQGALVGDRPPSRRRQVEPVGARSSCSPLSLASRFRDQTPLETDQTGPR